MNGVHITCRERLLMQQAGVVSNTAQGPLLVKLEPGVGSPLPEASLSLNDAHNLVAIQREGVAVVLFAKERDLFASAVS